MADQRQVLYLHIGLPKTGTTFLQAVLQAHREELGRAGLCHPLTRPEAMFHAAVEATGTHARWGLDPRVLEGTFDEILAAGRASGDTVVISHENFALARPESIEWVRSRLEGFEVHVVLTVRDLGRTLAAGWQESVKNGGSESFTQWTGAKAERIPKAFDGSGDFWGFQNVEDTLRRWSVVAPPERTHVVVCPRPGAAPGELWRRFAAAVGIPDGVVDPAAVGSGNESLAAPRVALLRDVNTALAGRIGQPGYSRVVKRWFAQQVLAGGVRTRTGTPAEVAVAFEPVARHWRDVVATGGYRCHGDLTDLEMSTSPDTPHPDDVSPQARWEGMAEVVATVLLRVRDLAAEIDTEQASTQREVDDLSRRLVAARERLDEATEGARPGRRAFGRGLRFSRQRSSAVGAAIVDTDPADGQVDTAGGPRQKLYLHVGLPKTGTSFLQAALRENREALDAAGFCYPRPYPGATFHAMVEMTHSYARWGQDPERVAGTFDKILAEGRASGRTVVVSHEGFGRAGSASLERIREHLEGFEVHVVVTVRDLGRTLTALWQEGVKNGIVDTFEEFTERTLAMVREGRAGDNGFLLGQNIEHTLRRWEAVAPPERTHVVVCPPSGAPRDELWNRFAAAVGIPAGVVDPLAVERANESLGAPQIALLRQVNEALGDRIAEPWRNKVVKRWFANGLLSRIDSGRISTPAHVAAELEPVAARWREAVVAGGYRCYGDLDDLALQVAAPGERDPDDTGVEEMYEGVPEVLADLLVRIRDQNVARREHKQESARRIAELRKSLAETERRLAEAESRLRESSTDGRPGLLGGRLRRRAQG